MKKEELRHAHADRLIGMKEVCHTTSLSKSTIYQMIRGRIFPAPVRVGRRTLFSQARVQDWIINAGTGAGGAA